MSMRLCARAFSVMLAILFLTIGVAPAALYAAPVASGHPGPSTSANTIGVVLPQHNSRWDEDAARFTSLLGAYGSASQILFSDNSSVVEKTNIESLIAQGMKVLILCPVNKSGAAAAVAEARAAGVKVIAYDRLILDTAAVDYYVTFDSKLVGRAQGQYLIDHAAGTGRPLYLYAGDPSDNNAFLFFEGSWEVLQPKIADGTFVIKNSSQAVALQGHATLTGGEEANIIAQITTAWDYNTAEQLAQANLAAVTAADKGDVSILAPNDGTARAIGDVFAADPGITGYTITGQDAAADSVQYIIDGKQSMTVFKDTRVLARDAVAAAGTYLRGGVPDATTTYDNGTVMVPSRSSTVATVDKDNLVAVLIDSAYYQIGDFTWPVISQEIPGTGGELASKFDSTTYLFPTGTFTDSVAVTHTTTFSTALSSGLEGIGHSFEIAAVLSGTGQAVQPTGPYTITVQYTDGQKGAVKETTLALYYWDGSAWVKEPTSTVNVATNTVTATPDHMSAWVVMGEIRKTYLPMAAKPA